MSSMSEEHYLLWYSYFTILVFNITSDLVRWAVLFQLDLTPNILTFPYIQKGKSSYILRVDLCCRKVFLAPLSEFPHKENSFYMRKNNALQRIS